MDIQKITKYVTLSLGVIGLILQFVILRKGDNAIEMDSIAGNFSSVSPIINLAIIILIIIVLITLGSSFASLASNPAKLKKAGISILAFLIVVLISFVFSEGVETPLKDGEVLSESGSRWVGTGLRTFYFLALIAIGTMIYFSVKRLLK
jgi:NADH:ubiquinone oxidoreductase subunit 6 (subunit J)